MNIFAVNLSFLVRKTGKGITIVAKEIGICASTLHLYMHGVTNTRIETLKLICTYFEMDAGRLLFGPINEEVASEFERLKGLVVE